jgi:xylose isomerase
MREAQPDHSFTFGLWTFTSKIGRDPFGLPTREPMDPLHVVRRFGELDVWGIPFHDDDLVPPDASPKERDRIVAAFREALNDAGVVVSFASVNLFEDPVFKDGAFTSADATVRARALQKALTAMDLGAEFDAPLFVLWGGREGTEVNASLKLVDALGWYRDALDYLCQYAIDQGYGYRLALEPKPNEPRGDLFLPTAGSMLGFIETLEHRDMVGVNPEFAHETMAGLSFPQVLAQVIDAGKLFHVDLNDQRFGRFDQDRRFGSENPLAALFTVLLLDEHYDGPLQFDAHALRTEDDEGVWDFVRNSMRSYRLFQEHARAFRDDPEVREWLAAYRRPDADLEALSRYSKANAQALKEHTFDLDALRERGIGLERIDQLATEHLLGVSAKAGRRGGQG